MTNGDKGPGPQPCGLYPVIKTVLQTFYSLIYAPTHDHLLTLIPPPPPPAILAKNLESAKIQHHAVTLPPNCWT